MTTDGVESLSANLAELFGEIPDPVLVLDPEGRVQWGNHAAERLFNRSLHDSIGFSGIELVHPDDVELVLRSLTSVQNKEVGTLIEVRAKAAKGWVLLEVLGAPVSWLGNPAVLFCLRDLTERRRFEVARGEEAKFRSLIQNSAALTILVSPTGLVDSVSGALSRVLGHDPELVEHRPLTELVLETDRPAVLDAFERASRGASASSPVIVAVGMLRHASIEAVPFELSIVNLVEDPTVGGYVVSAHDITARVAAEREVDRDLVAADRDLGVDRRRHPCRRHGRPLHELQHPLPGDVAFARSILEARDDATAAQFRQGTADRPRGIRGQGGGALREPGGGELRHHRVPRRPGL